MKRTIILLLSLCLLLGLLSACGTNEVEETPEPQAADPVIEPETLSVRFASSYEEVYDAVKAAQDKMDEQRVFNGMGMISEAAAADGAKGDGMGAGEGEGSGTYYSQTNVQVAGVDEGDIVKTDGTYFYILRDVELIIMKADGRNVSEVSHTIVGTAWDSSEDESGTVKSSEKSPFTMYLVGDRAVVLSSYFDWTSTADGESEGSSYVVVDVYDLGDRTAPKLVKSLGQDGYQIDSRVIGEKLFLCTAYYVDDPESGDPRTFAPCLYTDGKGEPVTCGTIGILPHEDSLTYAVVTSYDLDACAPITTQSILGGGDTVYMNADNLYLCRTVYGDREVRQYEDGPYAVTEHVTETTTTVNRFAISDGAFELAATGSVPGSLNNQFSLDEHDGYLRMATTENVGGYSLYVDEGHKFENYEPAEDKVANDVFVLDDTLSIVGSARDIAPDESVYSARFDGDFGYLCTYRTVDPIFAVDLSDPKAPVVVGEVKLSGYSDYLHIWTDNQLFGLGMQTQEISSEDGVSAVVDGLKMVMINTSDPAALSEENTLQIDADYSQALYNHKAILVDQARDLIAFPAEGSYLVYGYSAEQGFQLKKEISFENEWDWQSRGVYIGDYFYVIGSDQIYTIDLNTLENVGQTILSRG